MEFKICTKCNKSFPKTTEYFSEERLQKIYPWVEYAKFLY